MANITFKNILDETSIFTQIDDDNLLSIVYEYAKTLSTEMYTIILKQKISIRVNDEIIHPDLWLGTCVSDKDNIVITPILSGGDDGGFLQIVAGVAIMAVGYLVPGAQALIPIGASIALGGASSMIFAPDLPTLPMGGSKSTQTYNWSGISTMSQYGLPVPVVYGTHAIGGNIISAFTESEGDKNYLYMLLALCEGEIEGICRYYDHNTVCTTSDQNSQVYHEPAIMIDGQPLKNFNNVTWWYRTGANTQTTIPNFDGARILYSDGRTITTDGTVYTTTKEIDSIIVNVQAPAIYTTSETEIVENSLRYKIQWRLYGGGAWTDYTHSLYTPDVSVTTGGSSGIECTTYSTGDEDSDTEYATYTITVLKNTIPDFECSAFSDREVTPLTEMWYTVRIDVEKKDRDGTVIENYPKEWENRVYYSYDCTEGPFHLENTIAIDEYNVKITHNANVGDTYVISSTATESNTEWFTLKGKSATGVWRSDTLDFTDLSDGLGIYEINIVREFEGSSDIQVQDTLTLQSVLEIVDGKFTYPNTALLGFKILATGQLSGSSPAVITTIKGTKIAVPSLSGSEAFDSCYYDDTDSRFEYNGAERTWDEATFETEYSNNSMLCVRDLVLNDRYGLGKYIESSDLYSSGIISVIHTCHEKYAAYASIDLLDWWNNQPTSQFSSYFAGNTPEVTIDSTNRKLVLSGEVGAHLLFTLRLSTPTIVGVEYTLQITTSSMSAHPFYIIVFGPFSGSTTETGDGTYSVSGKCTVSKNTIAVMMYHVGTYEMTGDITNASLHPTDTALNMRNHVWNGVLESEQSAVTALVEMCSAFRCWPIWFESKFHFVIDKDDTPIHTLSMGNIVKDSFSQTWTPLSEIPYKLRGQYTDEASAYSTKALVATAAFTTLTKANERTIGLKGITNRVYAERELIFKLNKATNCTHQINLKCGIDAIHATAGDVINVQHQLPEWGGGGRIIDFDSGNKLVVIETPYTFADVVKTYTFSYQNSDNTFIDGTVDLASMSDVVSNGDSSQNIKLTAWPATNPCDSSIYKIGTTGSTAKPFRLVSVARSSKDEVEISGIEHLSSIYSAIDVTIAEESYSDLPDPGVVPDAPIHVKVIPLPYEEGLGFEISADPPKTMSSFYTGIVIQMSSQQDTYYSTISHIGVGSSSVKYMDPNLKVNHTYYFKLFCRTMYRDGKAAYASCNILLSMHKLPPPTGIRIRGAEPNNHEFPGKDCTIIWEAVGSTYQEALMVKGYVVEVYSRSLITETTSITNGNMELDSNWYDYLSPHTNEQSTTQIHGGTYSRKVAIDNGSVGGIQSENFRTTTNSLYTITVWVYPIDTTSLSIYVRCGDNSGYAYSTPATGLTQNTWNEITIPYTETSGGANAYLALWKHANSGECTYYIDDISISTASEETTISTNLLRTAFVKGEEYTYTVENNLEDSGLLTPYSSLIFILYTQNIVEIVSDASVPFIASNTIPPAIVSGVTAKSVVEGVEFSWDKSDELDHKSYDYRAKVSSGDWTDWKEIDNNILVVVLTSTEIDLYGTTATIYVEVKDRDWYGQVSATASTAFEVAGTIADAASIFVATMVGGTGDVAELYNDILKIGGVNF